MESLRRSSSLGAFRHSRPALSRQSMLRRISRKTTCGLIRIGSLPRDYNAMPVIPPCDPAAFEIGSLSDLDRGNRCLEPRCADVPTAADSPASAQSHKKESKQETKKRETYLARLGDDAGKVVADLGVALLVDELGGGLLARDGAREVVADLRVALLVDGGGLLDSGVLGSGGESDGGHCENWEFRRGETSVGVRAREARSGEERRRRADEEALLIVVQKSRRDNRSPAHPLCAKQTVR
jgi:hypothetical protein